MYKNEPGMAVPGARQLVVLHKSTLEVAEFTRIRAHLHEDPKSGDFGYVLDLPRLATSVSR